MQLKPKPPLKISLATTCMGRLEHIQQTLIRNIVGNLDYPGVEFVLLDYNSKDGLEMWVRKFCRMWIDTGKLVYYRTTEPTHFHMAHAKNMAGLLSSGEVIVNVDADNFVGDGFAKQVSDIYTANMNAFCRCSRRHSDQGSGGRIAMSKKAFIDMGGYNEGFIGWGLEDADLRQRSRKFNLNYATFDPDFCRAVQHNDEVRAAHHTPPGEEHRTVRFTNDHNREIYENNLRSGNVLANTDVIWGRGTVIKNFRQPVECGSHLMRGARFIVPNMPKTVFEMNIPKTAEDLIARRRTAGKFTLKRSVPKQTNEKL